MKTAHEPGRTAYEARCGDDKVGPRGEWDPWEMLPEEARAVWRRVEAASSAALREVLTEILEYEGGAPSAVEDEYVMGRVELALMSTATIEQGDIDA